MAREGEDYIDDDEDDAAEDEDEVKLEDLDRRESSVRSSKRSSSRRSHKSSRRKHENEADGQPRRKRQKKGNNNAAAEDTRGRSHRKNGDPQRSPNRDAKEVCKLFMQGKCPKSPTSCLYSHDADPPKIMELCKFYLFERCAKRDKCLYLHKGFPCKYYHTGTRCLDTAETCKFSHEPLTEELRIILLKVSASSLYLFRLCLEVLFLSTAFGIGAEGDTRRLSSHDPRIRTGLGNQDRS